MSLTGVTAKSIAALLLCASATGASAVSVTNRDGGDHKVTVIQGEAREDHVVKPSGVLDGICSKGCLLRLDDSADDPYELEGPEVTWIEGGELLEEQLDEAREPETGEPGQTSQPSP